MVAVHTLIIFSEKIGFHHSINSIKIFCIDKKNYISFLVTCRDLQIFKGKSYPADGWFVYDMASVQNASRGIVFI